MPTLKICNQTPTVQKSLYFPSTCANMLLFFCGCLWILRNSPLIPMFIYHSWIIFCSFSSGENGGERDLRGSPRDCKYDTVISVIPVIYCIPVIPVVWVVPFVPNSLVSPASTGLSACFNCKYFPICTRGLLRVGCLLGTGRTPCVGKNEERKIHDRERNNILCRR